ncbi:slp1p [Saccharomyces arboricola H-6]|uniref:SUN-like protein 1 n=1 Tax=Saccharomyces arboricola (strain H-6 / AS 2.3317 / CBS 10644) TaxID=1160507 RepID=J8PZ08_SACAR|nr:slp1p [Saccharomyces arboricola H-6]
MTNNLLLYGLILWVSIVGSFALNRNETAQHAKAYLDNKTLTTGGYATEIQKELSSLLSTGSLIRPDFRHTTRVEIRQAEIQGSSEKKEQGTLTQPINSMNLDDSSNSFLSFDEWKKAKSKEHSSSPERHSARVREPIDPSCYKEKDCIGEELEVDLGFLTNRDEWNEGEGHPKVHTEQKESIGEVYKKRFNYASLDCAATIVKSNSEAIGATSILIESKDKYLLNPCSALQQFVVIELCEDILVEEINIANYEFFSSTFKKLRVSVSDRLPVVNNDWTVLGEFEAENSRDLQRFQIHNPQIWASYLKIDILSHYDDEFYCPISLIRAHGKTMMDEFKLDQLKAQEDKEQLIAATNIDNSREANIRDKCNNIETHLEALNTSAMSDIPGLLSCTSKLIPLNFDEFFKEINASFCPPKQITPFPSSAVPVIPEESIFKNIMKRLSQLETNSSLTVSYIEEQSKLLSRSFEQLEMAHETKFDHLVTVFNETMMNNLDLLNNFANQLKDQSLRILEEQKLENDKFTNRHLLHLEKLEKEVSFQRRIVYASFFAFVGLMSYLLITRELYFEDFGENKNESTGKQDIIQQAVR